MSIAFQISNRIYLMISESKAGGALLERNARSAELDYETGLYYYGARYYDAKVSLWLNVDPLAEKYPEVSPYTYTLNNPIKYIDPKGLFETKFGAWWHRMWNGGKK